MYADVIVLSHPEDSSSKWPPTLRGLLGLNVPSFLAVVRFVWHLTGTHLAHPLVAFPFASLTGLPHVVVYLEAGFVSLYCLVTFMET
jgi:hypothetical protein